MKRWQELLSSELPKHKELWVRFAFEMVENVISLLPSETTREHILEQIKSSLNLQKECLYKNVNLSRSMSTDRKDMLERIARGYYGKNAIHLELGTWSAFPPDRVNRLEKERGYSEFIRLDLSPEFEPDIVANCSSLPFQDESIDMISSNSLFEHILYPKRTIIESYRTLTPGGIMQITMPYYFTQHGYPKDYLRLSPDYFKDICYEVGFDEVYCHVHDFGGLYYTLHNSAKAAVIKSGIDLEISFVAKILHYNMMTLLAMISPFDQYFTGEARNFFTSIYCAAIKKGDFKARPKRKMDDREKIDRLIPILMCPVSGQPLSFINNEQLTTPDRCHVYQVINSVPILLKNIDKTSK